MDRSMMYKLGYNKKRELAEWSKAVSLKLI
jgi:hypothetical protein